MVTTGLERVNKFQFLECRSQCNTSLCNGVVTYDFMFKEIAVRSKDYIIISYVGRTEFETRCNVLAVLAVPSGSLFAYRQRDCDAQQTCLTRKCCGYWHALNIV